MSNILMNKLFDSKILNIFITRFEFRDSEARFEKRRKRAFFDLFTFNN